MHLPLFLSVLIHVFFQVKQGVDNFWSFQASQSYDIVIWFKLHTLVQTHVAQGCEDLALI